MRLRNVRRGVAVALPVAIAGLALMPAAHAAPRPVAASTTAGQAPLTAARATALSKHVDDKVIVVFKNQLPSTPDTRRDQAARAASVAAVQASTVSELHETDSTDIKQFQIVDALSATVSSGEAARLKANPAVSEVVKDLPIPVQSSLPTTRAATTSSGQTPLPGVCEPSGKVQLDPQAIETIGADDQSGTGDTARALGYTGAGVKVGFIADGLDIDNPDFIRADGQHVFTDYQDFSGTGTNAPTGGGEAFLDASSIAAQGRETYNLQKEGADLSSPCLVRVEGVAPGASLVGLNVFGSADLAFNSVFLEAVNYAVNVDHVNVLNESFGSNPFPDSASLDLTREADDAAVAAGVTVTVSSGDAGPTNTIGSPATDPAVLSAGASTTYRSYLQSGIGDGFDPAVTGYLNNNISGLSSGGFAEDGSTVDVVAPGDLNWALCTPDLKLYADCEGLSGNPASLELSGGTSEAAPLTAGTAALVIQAYAKTHGGADPTPAVVKQIIVSTAQNIQAPADQQGAGLIDAYQAVEAAAAYPGGSKAATGHTLLASSTQLNAVGQPGTTQKFAETLTNTGSSAVTVGLASRTLSPYTAVSTKALTLDNANDDTTTVRFTVPKDRDRLNVSVALKGVVLLTLLGPSGKLAEYNLPQGQGNYGNAQVADPAAGTWTALVSGDPTTSSATARFQASTAVWQSFATFSPASLKLAPGKKGSFTATATTPAAPGDEAGSIILESSAVTPGTADSTVPVTLRSLVPTPAPSESFTGTLTGGNGRATDTGQSAFYQFTIPAGDKALDATVSTTSSANTFVAELIDPSTGEAASTAANSRQEETASGTTTTVPQDGAQLHVLAPAAGTWTLVVDFYNTVSGTAVSQPFTVDLDTTASSDAASGLPDSASTTLSDGSAHVVPVTVTNTGTTPEAYFIDARLDTTVTSKLAAQTSSSLDLPNLAGVVPEYLVPSHTTAIKATASSSAPLYFDYSWAFGDPDLISSSAPDSDSASGTLSATDVADGIWAVTPFLDGPTGSTAAKTVKATTGITATTAAFDPTVTSPTGDLWKASTNASAGFSPYVLDPGQTATIPVDITPTATAGTVVSGTLYVDDASLIAGESTDNELSGLVPQASDVAAFPYSYTTGS